MTPAPTPAPVPAPRSTAVDAPLDLLYSDTEDELRAAVRSLLTDRADTAALLARAEAGDPGDPGLWTALAHGIGAAGLLVPEQYGGQGASHREAAVVLEELGRAVTPAPYLTSSVIATEALLALGPEAPGVTGAAGLLTDLATGRATAALVVPYATAPSAPYPAVPDGGRADGVAGALEADVLLIPRADGLYALDRAGARVAALTTLDLTRPLATVTVPAGGTRLAGRDAAAPAVARALLTGAGLLASEQLGVAEWCLEETVAHTGRRHQFNRPIGSFQALKHRMAQLWLGIVSARAVARAAAAALAADRPAADTPTAGAGADTGIAVAVAQSHAATVAVRTAEECVQLHAGIGMTWEHPAHLYLKRAKSSQIALGSPGAHHAALAELIDLPAP
ncbi:acyl-CoA dehydrogenase family protein [Streptomyces yaizuensis]|uniref:Acyl-CoA/acyl-ACP dehydrogenase n=1 Tax=Streptomyces yaizuensis TaxID=2989713 RepID=A0ABQ5NSN4_9ACTN|nr:acyl-CoA dehydrogenase family protein [Streptomyces sp. YSPA8]GLF93174.1 acyl-CoA/acyl-ACP dehydrogenase [Streptomyces sp. YSPA8]